MSLALPADLTPEGAMLAELADRIAADVVAPVAADIDHAESVPADLVRTLSDSGLLGAGVPELIGEAVEPIYGPLVVSRLATASAAVAAIVAAVHEGAAGFDPERARDRLPGRTGAWVPTVVASGVGAVRASEGFVIRGEVPRAEIGLGDAGLIVIASVRAEDGGGEIVVELERARGGVLIGERELTTGMRGRSVASVTFENVVVGFDDVVGTSVEASRVRAMRDLMTSALALGVALGALVAAEAYAQERRQFGAALATFPAVRGHLLEMEQEVATVGALLWSAVPHLPITPVQRLGAIRAARAGVRATQSVPRLAVQVFGGYGFVEEYPVAIRMRDGLSITARAGGLEALSIAADAVGRGSLG